MERVRRSIGIFLILIVLLSGCAQVQKPAMDYTVRPCNASQVRGTGFAISSLPGLATIHQDQSYVCCANITITMKSEGKTLRIYEENVGEMCRCICPFEADIEIRGTQGFDRVEIYGIKFRDVQGYELLFNSSLA